LAGGDRERTKQKDARSDEAGPVSTKTTRATATWFVERGHVSIQIEYYLYEQAFEIGTTKAYTRIFA
jgi:hypothetical protein